MNGIIKFIILFKITFDNRINLLTMTSLMSITSLWIFYFIFLIFLFTCNLIVITLSHYNMSFEGGINKKEQENKFFPLVFHLTWSMVSMSKTYNDNKKLHSPNNLLSKSKYTYFKIWSFSCWTSKESRKNHIYRNGHSLADITISNLKNIY